MLSRYEHEKAGQFCARLSPPASHLLRLCNVCREANEEKSSLEKGLEESAKQLERARLDASHLGSKGSTEQGEVAPGSQTPEEADAECGAGGAPARVSEMACAKIAGNAFPESC